MNNLIAARLYFLFALLLLVIGWKICQGSSQPLHQIQANQAAQIEKALASME